MSSPPGGVYVFRTPHRFHELTANRLRGLPRNAPDPYPTVYAMNSRQAVRRLVSTAALELEVLRMIEKEPSYGKVSRLVFYPLLAYERLVNSSERFAGLRANILAVLRKSRA